MEVRDDEIIKALEYCLAQGITSECERCRDKIGCRDTLLRDALDLINSQKAEIERLQKAIKVQGIMIEQQDYEIKKAKSEARKEFAERVTDRICKNVNRSLDNPNGNNYYPIDVYKDIENLLAEMEERE